MTSLPPAELPELSKFVHSPAHCQHQQVIALFEYLKSDGPPNKSEAWATIAPGQVFNDGQFRHLMSYLLKTCEAWLAYKEQQSLPLASEVQTAAAYRKKGMDRHYLATVNAIERKAAKTSHSPDYYHSLYQLQKEQYDYTASQQRSGALNLQAVSDSLDTYFILSKIKLACLALTHQRMTQTAYELNLLDNCLQLAATSNEPLIQLYSCAYQMLSNNQEGDFKTLKQLLQQHNNTIATDELRDLLTLAINYCIRQLNDGKAAYVAQVFGLYQMGIESEALFIQGKLSPFTYRNIVSAGLRLKEYQWIENFIEEHTEKLDPEYRSDFYAFNLARLNFEQGEHARVVETINRIDIDDLLTKLAARVIQIKSFYELGEHDLLDSLVANLGQLVRRKKVLAYHRSNYRNFARYMKRLLSVNIHDQKAIGLLIKDIKAEEVLTEKPWLIQKLNEL